MSNPDIEIPILIIGGGPVGLALSIDLGWRGVDCVDLVGCPASSQFASASPTLT